MKMHEEAQVKPNQTI